MDAFVTRMRDAGNIDAYNHSDRQWLMSGSHETLGLSGPMTLRFDRKGRFRRSMESDLGVTEAFDGTRGWKTDITGMPGAFDLTDLAQAKLDVWITTGIWPANPDLIEVVSITDVPDSPEVTLAIRVPGSPLVGTLTVDRETALPIRLEMRGVTGRVVRAFHDSREVGGVRLPGRTVRSVSGLEDSSTTVTGLDSVATNGSSGAVFERPPSPPRDVRFTAKSGDVPLRFAPTGHLLVHPKVNGVETGAFIFDTGAGHSGVQTNPAPQLGLRQAGSGIVTSIFGSERNPILRGEELELGPLVLSDPVFMTMDFSPLEAVFGEPIAGIIGYDVLRRSVLQVDLADSRMQLHDPATYELPQGEWLDLRFQDNHPIIPATVEGRPGLFRLDLGAAGGPHGNVIFHVPAVQTLGLEDRVTEEALIGTQKAGLCSIESLELGGVTFGRTDVMVGLQDDGMLFDSYTTGNIGADILRAFEIVFDYSNARVALMEKR